MPTTEALLLAFYGFSGQDLQGRGGGHSEMDHQPPHRQMETTLLSNVWLREESGYHHHGSINPLLHPGLAVTREPDQRTEPSTERWSGGQPLHVVDARGLKIQEAR